MHPLHPPVSAPAYHSLSEHQRLAKIENLRKVVSQQSMFKKMNEKSQVSTHASYVVAYEIA